MIFQPKRDIFSVFYTMNLQIHGPDLHVLRTAVTLYHEFTIHGPNLHVLRTAVTLYHNLHCLFQVPDAYLCMDTAKFPVPRPGNFFSGSKLHLVRLKGIDHIRVIYQID